MNRRAARFLPLFLSFPLGAACTRTVPECTQAVQEFRNPKRSDAPGASGVDVAISLARAHRSDTSADCVLANRFADDAEAGRPVPSPSQVARVPIVEATPEYQIEAGGTPRVHLEIGVTPTPAAMSPSTVPGTRPAEIDHADPSTPPPNYETDAGLPATPAETATPAPAAAPAKTPDTNALCHKECDNTANFQARVACNQRCDGATPLPGATASPTIIH